MPNVRHNYTRTSKYNLEGRTVKAATTYSTAASDMSYFLVGGLLRHLKANFCLHLKFHLKIGYLLARIRNFYRNFLIGLIHHLRRITTVENLRKGFG